MRNEQLLKEVIGVVELFELMNKVNFEDNYNGLSINLVHAIDFIGNNHKPKVTDVANFLKITRGGATKITQRLMKDGYIEDYKVEENKKEKYFKLTSIGEEIFQKHKLVHETSIKEDSKMFSKLSDEEKKTASKFLKILKEDLVSKLSSKE